MQYDHSQIMPALKILLYCLKSLKILWGRSKEVILVALASFDDIYIWNLGITELSETIPGSWTNARSRLVSC
jgi:hypothetical protein